MKKSLLALIACFTISGAVLAAVNLNSATQEELEVVKGIGPKKAEAIVAYRRKNGPFKNVDDLKNVKGFGDRTLAGMRPELSVEQAAPPGAARKGAAAGERARK